MPTISIDGRSLEFEDGQTILEVALANGIEIPHYCYHPSMSVVASCRICLAEVWAPNPRNDNALEPIEKLLPTCQALAADGQEVHTNSPKAIANQKSVMEYLLINHPVDCPVCDQAGECTLQDYAYEYGRGSSRFEEDKVKQSKKDIGEHVLLYGDRCIMCTRCVRFTTEVTGTSELTVSGRGVREEIDVFPGVGIDNELSANVIDLCPVGALLDKDFLFKQRVWYLKRTPSIDPLTASGDNLTIEHNDGSIYRIKPRTNLEVNQWWITDEVRYGWKFVHDEHRLRMPSVRGAATHGDDQARQAWTDATAAAIDGLRGAGRLALLASPMLSCEDAWLLGKFLRSIDEQAILAVGEVPIEGEDKTFPGGFRVRSEKAPNARGVRHALEALGGKVHDAKGFRRATAKAGGIVITGNYPGPWETPSLRDEPFVVLIDTFGGELVDRADVVLPAATWAEKAGTFENDEGRIQAFEQAIEPRDFSLAEGQIALDLQAVMSGEDRRLFNAADVRGEMADGGLTAMLDVAMPEPIAHVESDMPLVEI